MGYRATWYVWFQTGFITVLGLVWLAITSMVSHISVLPGAPALVFGVVFGVSFYTFITVPELRSLSKTGIARVSVRSWLFLAFAAPAVFAVIYLFLAVSPLHAAVRFCNALICFVGTGGFARAILLHRWEKKHGKVVVANFGGKLYAYSK